jgi:hypothetical protein
VTDRSEKYEGMPDRVLETQTPPKMKEDTHRIYQAARREKPESQAWEQGNDGPVGHHATPTEKEIENNRYVIETPGQYKLQHEPTPAASQTPVSRPAEAMLIFSCAMKGV